MVGRTGGLALCRNSRREEEAVEDPDIAAGRCACRGAPFAALRSDGGNCFLYLMLIFARVAQLTQNEFASMVLGPFLVEKNVNGPSPDDSRGLIGGV